jgi:hypothetical protein
MDDLEKTVKQAVESFLSEEGLTKRELYFYPDELVAEVPRGKLVRVTIDLVSQAKHENRPETF